MFKCIWIDKGKIKTTGYTEKVISKYILTLSNINQHQTGIDLGIVDLTERINNYRPNKLIIKKIALLDAK